jgi:hypothetical protein
MFDWILILTAVVMLNYVFGTNNLVIQRESADIFERLFFVGLQGQMESRASTRMKHTSTSALYDILLFVLVHSSEDGRDAFMLGVR